MTSETVIVTGASGNLGRAVADAFAARGANLVLLDLRRDRLESAYGTDDARRMLVAANLLAAADVEAAVQAVIARFGRIDVLCNIAGGFRMGTPVHETSTTTGISCSTSTHARCCTRCAPSCRTCSRRAAGRSSTSAPSPRRRAWPHMGAYTASKGTVIRMTEAMAAELREKSINVNCVLPTIIDTPENRAAMPKADPARWVAPADLANVIVFLASDAARAVHGAAVPVTGLS